MEMTGGGDMFLCETQNTGGCQCAPACPSSYFSVGCSCVYGGSHADSALLDHSHLWLYVLSSIGCFAILFAVVYLSKRYLINNGSKIKL